MTHLLLINALLLAAVGSRVFAAAALEVTPRGDGVYVRVEADAPAVIELVGEDLIPIRWDRQGLREALLPVVAIGAATSGTLRDGSGHSYAVAAPARVVVNPGLRAGIGDWHGQPSARERRTILAISALSAAGLMLVLLIRRHTVWFALLYCGTAMGAVLAYQANRPDVVAQRDLESSRFVPHLARAPSTLRVEIAEGKDWIPVVESLDQLRSTRPRIEVAAQRAAMVMDLKQGEIIGLTRVVPK